MNVRLALIALLVAVLAIATLATATLTPAPAQAQEPPANLTEGCVENYDPAVDYFPQKATVKNAAGFSVEYFNNYKVVTIDQPWHGAEEGFSYVLVQCGTPAPDDPGDATVIEVPAGSLVTMSTTYLPFVVELGLLDRLVAHDELDYVTTPAVREKIDAGELAEVGEGSTVNVEVVLDLDPGLIMTYGSGFPDYDPYPPLVDAGLPVVINAEHMETTPLGRAEWLKFIAVFYNLEADGEALYDQIAADYTALATLAADTTERPTVFTGTPWDGTWYMPGGKSFAAQLLIDAGAAYLWADDDSSGSLYLDFESVFERAAEANFWINANGYWFSSDDVIATDERFAEFAPYQNGTIWENNLRLTEYGGNDYYEGGVANPHLVLADLIAIFHPELLPDHEFVYYQRVQ